MRDVRGLDFRPTEYRLEWMQDCEEDLEASRNYLLKVVHEVQPDLVHSNQYAYGGLVRDRPCVVVAHSDVVSWWLAVHGEEPPESTWLRGYRDTVTRGLREADAVVAPSVWALECIRSNYLHPSRGHVIYNGVSDHNFQGSDQKQECVLTVGRLWDQAKQISLLTACAHRVPVLIVGCEEHPEERLRSVGCSRPVQTSIKFLGRQSHTELRRLYANASTYAATAAYEPFGLAPLEAAFSRCALLANDIPVFHELWDDSAYYFGRNDPAQLAAAIERVASDLQLARRYGEAAYERALTKFSAQRMCEQYHQLYLQLLNKN
jgi:glycosyltransferase involved in cell wall biosynthesis